MKRLVINVSYFGMLLAMLANMGCTSAVGIRKQVAYNPPADLKKASSVHIHRFEARGENGNGASYLENKLSQVLQQNGLTVTDYLQSRNPKADIYIGARILEDQFDVIHEGMEGEYIEGERYANVRSRRTGSISKQRTRGGSIDLQNLSTYKGRVAVEYLIAVGKPDAIVMRPIVVTKISANSRNGQGFSRHAVMKPCYNNNIQRFLPVITSENGPAVYGFANPDAICKKAATLTDQGNYLESLRLLVEEYERLTNKMVIINAIKVSDYAHNIGLNLELLGRYSEAIEMYERSYLYRIGNTFKEDPNSPWVMRYKIPILRCFIRSGGTVSVPERFIKP